MNEKVPSYGNHSKIEARAKDAARAHLIATEKVLYDKYKAKVYDYFTKTPEQSFGGEYRNKLKNDAVYDESQIIKDNKINLDSTERYYDQYDRRVKDFVRLAYKDESGKVVEFVDISATIHLSRNKNIISTKVQGRDFSRNEFISNGDYIIKISGTVIGKYPDVYPYKEVSKLIDVLNHEGVLYITSPYLAMYGNIDGVVVKDFDIPRNKGFYNVQNYTISALVDTVPEQIDYEMKELIHRAKEIQALKLNTKDSNLKRLGKDWIEYASGAAVNDVLDALTGTVSWL